MQEKNKNKDLFLPYILIFALIGAFVALHPIAGEDALAYLAFVKKLLQGEIDFSLQGMHGQSFLITPIYLLTGGSELSSSILSIICYFLNITLIYKFVSGIYSKQTGRVAVYGYLTMAQILRNSFEGNSFSTQITLVLITLILLEKKRLESIFTFALAIIVKPSSLFIFPFFKNLKWKKGIIALIISGALIAPYFIATKIQSGMFLNSIGIKSGEMDLSIMQVFKNIIIIGYYFFSVPHLETIPNHPFSLMGSQTLVLFGLAGVIYYKKYVYKPEIMLPAIFLGYLAGGLVTFFDPLYVITSTLLLMAIGAEFVSKHMKLLSLVLITGSLEFFYRMLYEIPSENSNNSLGVFYLIVLIGIIPYEVLKYRRNVIKST